MTLEERVDALEKEVQELQASLGEALEVVRSVVASVVETPALASITEQIQAGRESAARIRELVTERKEGE